MDSDRLTANYDFSNQQSLDIPPESWRSTSHPSCPSSRTNSVQKDNSRASSFNKTSLDQSEDLLMSFDSPNHQRKITTLVPPIGGKTPLLRNFSRSSEPDPSSRLPNVLQAPMRCQLPQVFRGRSVDVANLGGLQPVMPKSPTSPTVSSHYSGVGIHKIVSRTQSIEASKRAFLRVRRMVREKACIYF